MIQLFKHNFFKGLLLVLLSLKGFSSVAENIEFFFQNNIEVYCEFDITDDFENETEDQNEMDESEKINQSFLPTNSLKESIAINNYIAVFTNYRVQYLEFSTPPPEFA